MAVIDLTALKALYETGDIPTQGNYVDLIDTLSALLQANGHELTIDAGAIFEIDSKDATKPTLKYSSTAAEAMSLGHEVLTASRALSLPDADGILATQAYADGLQSVNIIEISGSVADVDLSLGRYFKIVSAGQTDIQENFTINYSNEPTASQRKVFVIECPQDVTGSRVMTYAGGGTKFTKSNNVDPFLTQAKASAIDKFFWEWSGTTIDVGPKKDIVTL